MPNPYRENQKPKKKKDAPKLTQAQWWRAEEYEQRPDQILDNLVKQLEDDQQGRYEAYKEYERLFGASVGPNGDDSFRSVVTDELTQNELQNTIETLWAQVFKNKVVPAVSVSETDWEEWDRARGYGRWLEGALDAAHVYEEAFPQAGLYSLTHGTGFIRVGWKEVEGDGDGKYAQITSWAVNPRYFMVDRLESKHGKPRSIFFKDHIDRYVLHETYSHDGHGFYGSASERCYGIDHCTSNDDMELGAASTSRCDMITVREAYHLPSGPKAKDGRHVIWIKGCTLVDEAFDWDRFPMVKMMFGRPMEGYYGESAVKRLAPTQKNLDKLNKKIDMSQDVMGVPRIIIRAGSGIVKSHIDDIPGGILEAENPSDIKDWNAQCASMELYQDRDNAPRKMRSLLGVSDFEVQQQMPAGMRDVSGAMLERWVDQGQARHAMFHAQYENAVVDLSYLYALQAEECQKMGYKLVVNAPAGSNKTSIESLDFEDVCIDRKRMKLRVQPMSQLPQTFAGKVEAFAKLKNEAGVNVDPKTVLRNLEIPDLNGVTDMLVSDEEIIMKNLGWMVKKGQYLAPMPFDNLDLIVQMTTRYINHYRIRNDSDSERIALLAQYIDDAIALKNGLTNDPNAPPPAGGVPPMAVPPGMPPLPGAPPMAPPGGPMAPPGPLPPVPGPMAPPLIGPTPGAGPGLMPPPMG